MPPKSKITINEEEDGSNLEQNIDPETEQIIKKAEHDAINFDWPWEMKKIPAFPGYLRSYTYFLIREYPQYAHQIASAMEIIKNNWIRFRTIGNIIYEKNRNIGTKKKKKKSDESTDVLLESIQKVNMELLSAPNIEEKNRIQEKIRGILNKMPMTMREAFEKQYGFNVSLNVHDKNSTQDMDVDMENDNTNNSQLSSSSFTSPTALFDSVSTMPFSHGKSEKSSVLPNTGFKTNVSILVPSSSNKTNTKVSKTSSRSKYKDDDDDDESWDDDDDEIK